MTDFQILFPLEMNSLRGLTIVNASLEGDPYRGYDRVILLLSNDRRVVINATTKDDCYGSNVVLSVTTEDDKQ